MQIRANAKVNIGLKITGQLPNGYHTLHSLFQEIDYGEWLEVERSPQPAVQFTAEGIPVPLDESNLCIRAAQLFRQRFSVSEGIQIHLNKTIPIGAGLGGGSSDAAAVLKAACKLFELDFSLEDLIPVGAELGADVPFFLKGGLQLAENIGDLLKPLPNSPWSKTCFLLVFPDFSVSTAWAYQELKFDLHRHRDHPKFAPLTEPVNWPLFENDFERIIISTYPEAGRIKSELLRAGAVYASLSGSGSTMFGIFDDRDCAAKAAAQFAHNTTRLTRPLL